MIYELLHVGEENALSQEYLKNALGYSNTRSVRKQVELERKAGYVILSSNAGYYLPANDMELTQYINRNAKRLKNGFITLKGARTQMNQTEGQEELKLDDGQQDTKNTLS